LKGRIGSTLLLWSALLGIIYLFGVQGGVWIITVVGLLTQNELYGLFEKMGQKPNRLLGLVGGASILLGTYYLGEPGQIGALSVGSDIFVICLIVMSMSLLASDLRHGRSLSFLPTLFGLLYVPFMLHFFIVLIKGAVAVGFFEWQGMFLALWIVATAKFTDVGALLCGLAFGRHKMAPILSPGKTWEGAIGGILFSGVVGVLLIKGFPKIVPEGFTAVMAFSMAIFIAIAGIAADLIESAFKRQAGVKDSGSQIPGIGGVFDLTDSLILTAPLGYLFFKYFLFLPLAG
jgi:phosphatidate cytidylyltransferase